MEYKGKLYGKVGKSYFPLVLTTKDVDAMEQELLKLRKEVNKNCNAPDVSKSLKCDCKHSGSCRYEEVILETKELCRHKE